jgi:hypothetical protein
MHQNSPNMEVVVYKITNAWPKVPFEYRITLSSFYILDRREREREREREVGLSFFFM